MSDEQGTGSREQKVYLVFQGTYEDRDVVGVYDSAARAMGAYPAGTWTLTYWCWFESDASPRNPSYLRSWNNSHPRYDNIEIVEQVLVGDGPEAEVTEIIEQRYRPSNGGWDYVVISAAEGEMLMARKAR